MFPFGMCAHVGMGRSDSLGGQGHSKSNEETAWRKSPSSHLSTCSVCLSAPWPAWASHLAMQLPALAKLVSPQTSGLSAYCVHCGVVGT